MKSKNHLMFTYKHPLLTADGWDQIPPLKKLDVCVILKRCMENNTVLHVGLQFDFNVPEHYLWRIHFNSFFKMLYLCVPFHLKPVTFSPKIDLFFFFFFLLKLRACEYFMPFLIEEFYVWSTLPLFAGRWWSLYLLGALAPSRDRASRSLRVERSSDLTSLLAHLLQ